ncbi:hypothetical protein GWO43_23755 [candidate division KSB1 bacterium]|nr:hypothetical protein [candidate division KSB1 bacterium]NIR73286.1 hypothetical protein [candidate division KSB1 bacterium]NIS26992.1 hypothetical protein [candidate division KSB1 bacterium]NIT73832.1 hypothetical protein [candidate division KSB1 bacterium]NIU27737.1 hypothetical protein [candidate division KSB1 bacterium]
MAITEIGKVIVSHRGGTRISIFALEDGKHIKTMSDEDFYGPEMNNTRACERIVPISKTLVILLFSGFINQFVIYDLEKDNYQLVAFERIDRKKSHAVRAISGSHESRILLLEHPRITHGQKGEPKIVFFNDAQRTGEFKVFSELESPILSEYFADWDQIRVLSDGSICASKAVSDRIYRYDAQGKPLQAFTYPSGILKIFKEENSGPLDFDKRETIAN